MNHKRFFPTFAMAALVLGLLLAGTCAQAQVPQGNITGTWTIVVQSPYVHFIAMMQFGADGNVITTESDEFAISQGVWTRVDGHTFALTMFQYDFAALQQPYDGTFKVRARLSTTQNNELISGPFHLDFYDTGGTLQFTDDGTINGYRVHVEPMP